MTSARIILGRDIAGIILWWNAWSLPSGEAEKSSRPRTKDPQRNGWRHSDVFERVEYDDLF